jgi:hypothetical protein
MTLAAPLNTPRIAEQTSTKKPSKHPPRALIHDIGVMPDGAEEVVQAR